MKLHDLYPFPEERASKKRVGRGPASGTGCTAGKGNKGQKARAGGSVKPSFEGGQMPLRRRLPKRGFKNAFRTEYHPLNLERIIEAFPEANEVSLEEIYARGLARRNMPVKVLAGGELSRAVTVHAHRFSVAATEKITAAGGQAVAVEG